MRFYTNTHQYYCGIDLHARRMYICIMYQQGKVLYHRNRKATPEDLLAALKPYREDVVVCVECMFAWYWVADVCADEGITFVLGHALGMRAVHGSKKKNDKIDSERIARLLLGKLIPMSYVYPAGMRETRALLRRRMYLMHYRSEILGHVQCTRQQYNLPALGRHLGKKGERVDLADEFPEGKIRELAKVDLNVIEHLDGVINELEVSINGLAKVEDPVAIALLRTIHGVGKILGLVMLYEIHTITRFKSAQDFCSYARLVKCEASSDGKKSGLRGGKQGNAYLKWAFSEAALVFVRGNAATGRYYKRLESKHGTGKALGIIAHRLGIAVYYMLTRKQAFDPARFLNLSQEAYAALREKKVTD